MMHSNLSISSCWIILLLVFVVHTIFLQSSSSKWIVVVSASSTTTITQQSSNYDNVDDEVVPMPRNNTKFGRLFYFALNVNTYGFPLVEGMRLGKITTSVINCTSPYGYSPLNVFSIRDNFDIFTAAPNIDVLYSKLLLDLSNGPVIIEHPDMGDRYFSFQLNDPFSKIIEYLGSRTTGRTGARFAIKWKHDNTTRHTHLTNIKKTSIVDFVAIGVVGRVLVTDLATDLDPALQLMKQFTAIPPGGKIIVPTCTNHHSSCVPIIFM